VFSPWTWLCGFWCRYLQNNALTSLPDNLFPTSFSYVMANLYVRCVVACHLSAAAFLRRWRVMLMVLRVCRMCCRHLNNNKLTSLPDNFLGGADPLSLCVAIVAAAAAALLCLFMMQPRVLTPSPRSLCRKLSSNSLKTLPVGVFGRYARLNYL